jgi:glycosyltransferase involved in cell wall biosynthesis
MSTRLISVVIPCLNVAGTLCRLVESLLVQELPEGVAMEIIAVDNGSTDGTSALLAALPVLRIDEPRRGPAAARNAGIRAARGEVIVFLDADTRAADPRLVAEHLRTLDEQPNAGISGGAITHDPGQRSLLAFAENATALFNWHNRLPARELTFQPAGNQAFRRNLVEELGPFDESLLCLEDFEWSQRVVRAGYKVVFNPKAGVYITGRERFGAIMKKFYTWGLNVRGTYLPGRSRQLWLFREHPMLFLLNAPLRMVNETWVTVKRWFPAAPARTVLAVPLFLLYRAAWATGIAVGAHRYYRLRGRGEAA